MKNNMEISQKIIDYAIRYYLRYYPSQAKMRQKLDFKFGPESEKWKMYGGIFQDEIDYILNEKMRNIIQEEEVCKWKIKSLVRKWKNISYIKNNLRQKMFCLDMIEKILVSEYNYQEASILNEEKIIKKVRDLKSRWKSVMHIKQKLIERELDREQVEKIIEEAFVNGDSENIELEYRKLKDKYEKQKVIEKLLRKWFQYGDIKNIIEIW